MPSGFSAFRTPSLPGTAAPIDGSGLPSLFICRRQHTLTYRPRREYAVRSGFASEEGMRRTTSSMVDARSATAFCRHEDAAARGYACAGEMIRRFAPRALSPALPPTIGLYMQNRRHDVIDMTHYRR